MTPPPRDESGDVTPHNHEGITADDGVIRRVSERWVVPDKRGGKRLSSMAYKASTDAHAGMSVDLEALIVEAGLDAAHYVTTPRWVGSIRFTAGSLRGEGFRVGFDPLEENPFHGEVWGNFTREKQRKISQLADWFVPIDGVSHILE